MEVFSKIDDLQRQIEAYGTFPPEILKKVDYKFRLEWNYHSNSMEGNTLTREETRSVMVGNITVSGKPLKDIKEMAGHDKVITDILLMGKGELNITESRIRDVHRAIIHEDDPAKQPKTGAWKTEANHVINYRGEKFDFTVPADVPEQMHVLINWLNAEKDKVTQRQNNALHPGQLAFEFHVRYLTIHPFYDGNGRTARIFTNLILISFGYPPLYIKVQEKDTYNRYLADIQAYGGNPDLLYDFMGGLLMRSQQIVLDALAGKDIEEPDDLDKKIKLLESRMANTTIGYEIKKELDEVVFFEIYDGWLQELLQKGQFVFNKFNQFFLKSEYYLSIDINGKRECFEKVQEKKYKDILSDISDQIYEDFPLPNADTKLDFSIAVNYEILKSLGKNNFSLISTMSVTLYRLNYNIGSIVHCNDAKNDDIFFNFPDKLLDYIPSDMEMTSIANNLGNAIYRQIEIFTDKKLAGVIDNDSEETNPENNTPKS